MPPFGQPARMPPLHQLRGIRCKMISPVRHCVDQPHIPAVPDRRNVAFLNFPRFPWLVELLYSCLPRHFAGIFMAASTSSHVPPCRIRRYRLRNRQQHQNNISVTWQAGKYAHSWRVSLSFALSGMAFPFCQTISFLRYHPLFLSANASIHGMPIKSLCLHPSTFRTMETF